MYQWVRTYGTKDPMTPFKDTDILKGVIVKGIWVRKILVGWIQNPRKISPVYSWFGKVILREWVLIVLHACRNQSLFKYVLRSAF